MNNIHFVLLVFSFVLGALATIGVPAGRYSLLAAAFTCYIASLIFA